MWNWINKLRNLNPIVAGETGTAPTHKAPAVRKDRIVRQLTLEEIVHSYFSKHHDKVTKLPAHLFYISDKGWMARCTEETLDWIKHWAWVEKQTKDAPAIPKHQVIKTTRHKVKAYEIIPQRESSPFVKREHLPFTLEQKEWLMVKHRQLERINKKLWLRSMKHLEPIEQMIITTIGPQAELEKVNGVWICTNITHFSQNWRQNVIDSLNQLNTALIAKER